MESNTEPPQDAIPAVSHADWLFERLPAWVIDTLSTEQKEAIHNAAVDPTWQHPPINIRLSLPFFRRRYFLTIVGGEGKRSADRRTHERHRYPLRTVSNIFFILGIATIFYIIAIVAVALQSAIVEF